MGYKKYFPRSSFTICSNFPRSSLPSSNINFPRSSFLYKVHFPRSSYKVHQYEERGKLTLYRNEERGKLKLKNLPGNPIFLYPAFQAFSGIFKPTLPKSTWKKPTFGTSLITGTQGNQCQKWMSKLLFLAVKSIVFEPPTLNCLGLELILRHFRA